MDNKNNDLKETKDYYRNRRKHRQNIENDNTTMNELNEEFNRFQRPQNLDDNNTLELNKEIINKEEPKKEKKQKSFRLAFILGPLVLIVILLGTTYAFFNFTREDSRQADMVAGEVYVKILENKQTLSLTKQYPMTADDARARNDNYVDFTVVGKNTSETNVVDYNFRLTNGEDETGKTRIDGSYLLFDLAELDSNNNETLILSGVTLSEFNSSNPEGTIIPLNTTSEISKKYRVRMWISEDVTIGNLEGATYTQEQFENLYANFTLGINSSDKVYNPAYSKIIENVDTTTTINFAYSSSSTNGQGIYILSGTESDNYPIYYYRGDINNNNVIFGGFCWQMVRTTETGGIKMIYNGEPDIEGSGDNVTYNCGTTRDIQDTVMTTAYLSSSIGYYYADDYEIVSTEGNGVIYKLKQGTNSITRVPVTTANASTTIPTIATNYPYTCLKTSPNDTCKYLYKIDSYVSGTEANAYAAVDRTIIGFSAFNSVYQSLADVGYMNNERFTYSSSGWTTNALFANSASWNGSAYELTDASVTTPDATHHYSCNSTNSTSTCSSLRYAFSSSKTYITLTNGDLIEDALYKMTGTGSQETKTKNASYVLNQNNSTAKTAIDNWFRTNLTNEVNSNNPNYSVYLEDTVYCNDRSYKTIGSSNTYTQSGWNPNGESLSAYLYFGTHNRFLNNWYSTSNVPAVKNTGEIPNIACPNESDRFTVSSSNGNGALTYPVGLLTVDEIVLAGRGGVYGPSVNYLYTTNEYSYDWTLSPSYGTDAYVYSLIEGDFSSSKRVNSVYGGLRPVVSLKQGVEFETGGDGTPTNPYIVKYE